MLLTLPKYPDFAVMALQISSGAMGTIVTILPGGIVTVLISVLQLAAIVTILQCVTFGVLVQCCNIASSDAVLA